MKPNFQANQVFHFLLAAQEPLLLNSGNCVHQMKNMALTDDLLLQSLFQDLPTSSYFLLPTQPQIIEDLDFFRLCIKVPNIACLRNIFFFSVNHSTFLLTEKLSRKRARAGESDGIHEWRGKTQFPFEQVWEETFLSCFFSSLFIQKNNIQAQGKHFFSLYKNKGALRSWRMLQMKTTRGYNTNHN